MKKNPKFQKPPKNCKSLQLQNTLKPKIAKNYQNFAISQKHKKIQGIKHYKLKFFLRSFVKTIS